MENIDLNIPLFSSFCYFLSTESFSCHGNELFELFTLVCCFLSESLYIRALSAEIQMAGICLKKKNI